MKSEIGIFRLPEFLGTILQRQQFQIAYVVHGIIARIINDVVVYRGYDIYVSNAKYRQFLLYCLISGTMVMNLDIQHGHEAQLQFPVIPVQFCQDPCQFG